MDIKDTNNENRPNGNSVVYIVIALFYDSKIRDEFELLAAFG